MASASVVAAPINWKILPSPSENQELYTQLLRLRDDVVAGKHASFKLSAAAIERLKASQTVSDAQPPESQPNGPLSHSAVNGAAFSTNHAQLQSPSSVPNTQTLPGLQNSTGSPFAVAAYESGAQPRSAHGLDPIFLEKSDSLIRAEGALKRQRLDRDLQAQVDQRKHSSRDKDPGVEAASPVDIDAVLIAALERVKPVLGFKEMAKSRDSSSFDENDYYSSQVQSDRDSDASASRGSDKPAGAFTADFERLDGDAPMISNSFATHAQYRQDPALSHPSLQPRSKDRQHVYTNEPDDVYEVAEEDDEYTPPDAAAFDSFRDDRHGDVFGQDTLAEDENSEYEPGEVADSNVPTPQNHPQQPPFHAPVYRNHLTHIVAPQPNRVSPLATAKGPDYQLELVNGRPEMVKQAAPNQKRVQSRASTASPSGNGGGGSGKKRRNKKRKRDAEPVGRAKKRRDRQVVPERKVPSAYDGAYIKAEPISPPPFASVTQVVPQVALYGRAQDQQRPVHIDLSSPRYIPQAQIPHERLGNGLQYHQSQPLASPAFVRMNSPTAQRPHQRDTQDLRRVASLHHAQRAPSPSRNVYSPVAPYRVASMNHGGPNPRQHIYGQEDQRLSNHVEHVMPESNFYSRTARSPSPPPDLGHHSPYVDRNGSPAMMPPPTTSSRQYIVDQHGNKYYAAEPTPATTPRQAVIPQQQQQTFASAHERNPSQPPTAYYQPLPPQFDRYDISETRMAPPPPPSRRQTGPEQYVPEAGTNGYYISDQSPHSAERARYSQVPTSPIYQQVQGYEQMPPPPPPQQQQSVREPTSPIYAPSRSYSVRPEVPPQIAAQPGYLRHASVAPVQYVRQDYRHVSPTPAGGVVSSQNPTGGSSSLHQQQDARRSVAPVQSTHQEYVHPSPMRMSPMPPPAEMRARSVTHSKNPSSSSGNFMPQQQSYQAEHSRAYSQAPQGIKYVDQFGNEVYPREVREVRY